MKKISTVTLVAISMFAALTAIGAFIRIPLPFVPFTLQVLFVFLAGSLLGRRAGMLSQLVYVGVGLAGLPVFTQGGGFGYILQPTFGYLLGFIAGAFVIGWIIERIEAPKLHHFVLANLTGLMVVYLVGVPYLYLAFNTWMGVPNGWGYVFMIGFVHSIGGDLIISFLAGLLAIKLYKASAMLREKRNGNMQRRSIA